MTCGPIGLGSTIGAMPKDDVLARVERDLAQGHTHLAMQRLASLTASFPDDLGIRERRATLNRQIGNRVEAGRWGFLSETVEPAEVAAFERAYPRAWARLRALRLRSDPADRIGPLARQRLERLVQQAESEPAGEVVWTDDGPEPRSPYMLTGGRIELLVAALFVGFLVVFVGLAVVGLVTLVYLAL